MVVQDRPMHTDVYLNNVKFLSRLSSDIYMVTMVSGYMVSVPEQAIWLKRRA